jgi:hypothetical protein
MQVPVPTINVVSPRYVQLHIVDSC